jgi:ribosomal protein S18 acetylase RimI-like enzyme
MVVELDGAPAGRFYVTRIDNELRLADVIVAPEVRGGGIGTALIRSLLARAEREGLDVTLHVETWNPARALYERLGFHVVETRGINFFMRRAARGQLKTAS